MKIRCFIALPASPALEQEFSRLQLRLKASEASVRWERPEKFHITLKFLGDIDESLLSSLTSSLNASVQEVQSFTLSFRSVGGFPSSEQPRIVWVGADDHPTLATLHQHVEEVCSRFGVKKDDRIFHPHVTLGRVTGTYNIHRLTEVLKNITFEPLDFRCAEIRTMRSELLPTGSSYTLMSAIPLQP